MTGQNKFDPFGDCVPDAHGGVFGRRGEAWAGGGLQVVGLPREAGDPF